MGVAGRERQWLQSRWRLWRVFLGEGQPGTGRHRRCRAAGQGAAPWSGVVPIAAMYAHNLLAGHSSVRVADIGCGAGRYDLLLFHALPGLHLTCIDNNPAMLGKAAQSLTDNGIDRFETRQTPIETLELGEQSFNCVVSFNAAHHFDLDNFFRVTRDGLKEDGHLFVYTRLPAQNARTIWGRYFPGFVEKEAERTRDGLSVDRKNRVSVLQLCHVLSLSAQRAA